MAHRLTPPRHRTFARSMRGDATKAENILLQALRNKQLEGLKFKRQVPLGGYILDFVCFDAKLIIEVDGGQHSESRSDIERDGYFESQGFQTLRLPPYPGGRRWGGVVWQAPLLRFRALSSFYGADAPAR